MERESNSSLQAKALLAWQYARPQREATRLLQRAEKLERVHEKLALILGTEYEIEMGINSRGDIIARVEDLKFTTYSYDDDLLHIVPLVSCPLCGKEVSLGYINDLAELGEALEKFEHGLKHQCSLF